MMKINYDVVKRWINEAQEAASSDNVMVQVCIHGRWDCCIPALQMGQLGAGPKLAPLLPFENWKWTNLLDLPMAAICHVGFFPSLYSEGYFDRHGEHSCCHKERTLLVVG